jgi:hypothetical protein
MKTVTWTLFVVSIAITIGLLVAKYFSLSLPIFGDISSQGETVLLVAYGLLLVAIFFARKASPIGEGPWTVLGGLAGAVAAVVTLLTVWHEHKRSTDVATLQLFVELERSRPANTRFCRCALVRLLTEPNREPFDRLLARQTVRLSANVQDMLDKCISDITASERQELVEGNSLTTRGASFFADRVSRILNYDDDVALAVNTGIVRRDMVTESLYQSLSVAKIVADAYERQLKIKGFPNIQKLKLDEKPRAECDSPTAISSPQ